MNERDLQMMTKIKNELGHPIQKNIVLFKTKYIQLSRINLILLKLFLDEEQWRGVFVVLDRPHQYMAYLLQMHGVSQKNLAYVDTITHFSGENIQNKREVHITEGPFHIELLLNAFSEGASNGTFKTSDITLKDINFIIIDNISTMNPYNTVEELSRFIDLFIKKIKSTGTIFLGIALDPNVHKQLYEILRSHCDKEIEIKEEWFRG